MDIPIRNKNSSGLVSTSEKIHCVKSNSFFVLMHVSFIYVTQALCKVFEQTAMVSLIPPANVRHGNE